MSREEFKREMRIKLKLFRYVRMYGSLTKVKPKFVRMCGQMFADAISLLPSFRKQPLKRDGVMVERPLLLSRFYVQHPQCHTKELLKTLLLIFVFGLLMPH